MDNNKQFLDAYSVMFIILGILSTCGGLMVMISALEDFTFGILCMAGFLLLVGIGCLIFGVVTIVKKHK